MADDADDGNVTLWIEQMKAGDPAAVKPLRGHTALFHAARRGIQAVEAAAESGVGVGLVSRRSISLTLDMYTCASLDGYVRS